MFLQLAYVSSATVAFSDEDLVRLLEAARKKNFRRGVGGVLLYQNGHFLQILEGKAEDVESLFATIAGDPRHRGVQVLSRRSTDARVFFDWRMGFLTPEALLHAHPGFSHALSGNLPDCDSSFIVELVEAFRIGSLSAIVSDAA